MKSAEENEIIIILTKAYDLLTLTSSFPDNTYAEIMRVMTNSSADPQTQGLQVDAKHIEGFVQQQQSWNVFTGQQGRDTNRFASLNRPMNLMCTVERVCELLA